MIKSLEPKFFIMCLFSGDPEWKVDKGPLDLETCEEFISGMTDFLAARGFQPPKYMLVPAETMTKGELH